MTSYRSLWHKEAPLVGKSLLSAEVRVSGWLMPLWPIVLVQHSETVSCDLIGSSCQKSKNSKIDAWEERWGGCHHKDG